MKNIDEKLENLKADICDKLCHWPNVITDQEEMLERCDSCPVMIALDEMYDKYEKSSIA
jgi:hypothetical protein